MIKHGDDVEMSTEEASGGQKRGIVRYVLAISLFLALVAMSIIWITGAALAPDNPTPAPSESVSNPAEPPAGLDSQPGRQPAPANQTQ